MSWLRSFATWMVSADVDAPPSAAWAVLFAVVAVAGAVAWWLTRAHTGAGNPCPHRPFCY